MDKKTLELEIQALRNQLSDREKDKSQHVLDIAGSMFIGLDKNGYVTLANQKAAQVLGLPVAEIVGKDWFQNFLPKKTRKQVFKVFQDIVSGKLKQVEYYENAVINNSGEERIIAWHNSILRDEHSEITSLLSSGIDITDRFRAEEELKAKNQQLIATEQQLRAHNQQLQANEQQLKALNQQLSATEQQLRSSLLEQERVLKALVLTEKIARVGSWEWEVEDDKVRWSDELFRIFRLDPDKGAPSYKDHHRIYTPESMEKLDRAVEQALKKSKSYELDLEIIRGDGTKAFCYGIGFARKNAKGEVTGLYGSFQDISKFKSIELELSWKNKELLAQQQQLKALNQQLTASNKQLSASEAQLRMLNQELNESEEFLNMTNEMALVGGWRIDLDKNKVFWTKTTKKIHEVSANFEPDLDTAIDFFHEEDRPMVRKLVEKARNNNQAYDFEARLVTKKGNVKWVRSIGKPVIKEGKCIRLSGSFQDITNRRKLVQELREREKTMQYIVKHDPNALAVYDMDLKYLAVSDRYLDDYNIQEKDVIGKHHYEVFPEMPKRWKDIHKKVLKGNIERNDDDWFERPDGSISYNRWECRPWYLSDGSIGGMITYTEVTTERKLAELALMESEQRFRDLFSRMKDGAIILDDTSNKKVKTINSSASEILGVEPEHVTGKVLKSVIPSIAKQKLLHTIRNIELGKNEIITVSNLKRKIFQSLDPPFHYEVNVFNLPSRETVLIIHDLTSRSLMELELKKSLEQIQMLSRHIEDIREEERSQIARNLHDDLGQILTAVKMDVTWALKNISGDPDKLGPRMTETVAYIDEAIESVHSIVTKLRPPILDNLGIYESIEHFINQIQVRTDIQFHLAMNAGKTGISSAMKTTIFRIVQEATTNIIRHSNATESSIEITESQDWIQILIQDNGKGITREQIEAPRSFGIIGIRERVQRWEGDFEISKRSGGGTLLNIKLPLN